MPKLLWVIQMNKKFFVLLLAVFITVIYGLGGESLHAEPPDKPYPFEKLYVEIGYKTVPEAVMEAERHFEKDLKLPLRMPPIPFTHSFGRFNNMEGELNDEFEVEYISETAPENHYKMNIRPIKYKISISDEDILKVYKLKNEEKALYASVSGFNVLVFEKDDWQYMLSIDNRISNTVTPKTLVEIADSVS